jgi:hypothetical protein
LSDTSSNVFAKAERGIGIKQCESIYLTLRNRIDISLVPLAITDGRDSDGSIVFKKYFKIN